MQSLGPFSCTLRGTRRALIFSTSNETRKKRASLVHTAITIAFLGYSSQAIRRTVYISLATFRNESDIDMFAMSLLRSCARPAGIHDPWAVKPTLTKACEHTQTSEVEKKYSRSAFTLHGSRYMFTVYGVLYTNHVYNLRLTTHGQRIILEFYDLLIAVCG